MTTIFRARSAEASRSAFNMVESANPVKIKSRVKLVRSECPVPYISNPQKFSQRNLLATPKAVSMLFSGPNSIRYSHTDVSFPDFESYRHDSSKDVTKRSIDTEDQRKIGPYLAYGVGGIIGLYSVKHIANTIIAYKGAPRSMLALAAIEINLKDIPEGKSATYLWRGKPVFVRHRTKEQIERERAVQADTLRDPQTDDQRVKKAEWLVVIGVCTHLGCVPLPNAGLYGGYYCPCHGSHYDTSGRIRQGPAPLNLEVPEHYEFVGDDKLVVGKP